MRTCCKLVANLLTPVNVGGAVSEATDAGDVDEVAIIPEAIEPGLVSSGLLRQINQRFQNLAFQERKDCLRSRIRLRQRRERRLLKNLSFRQVRRLLSYIGVPDAGLRLGEVRDLRLRQIDRIIQFVFTGADDALSEAQIGDGLGERRESRNCVTCVLMPWRRALSPQPRPRPDSQSPPTYRTDFRYRGRRRRRPEAVRLMLKDELL